MTRRLTLIAFAITVALYAPFYMGGPTQIHAATPLAVLLSCQGDVTVVKSSGETLDGDFGLALHAGDVVKTGAASIAEILLESDNVIQVEENSSMRVRGAKSDRATTGSAGGTRRNFQSVQKFLTLKSAEGTSSIARLRGDVKKPDLEAVYPRQTRIQDTRPRFEWVSADPSAELLVKLYNDEGIQWEQTVTGTNELALPDDAPALTRGANYSWSVETADPLYFPPQRATAFFEIATDDEISTLHELLLGIKETQSGKASPSSYHLLRASAFFETGLFDEAIRETKLAIEGDQQNPVLHSILAHLYAEVGRTAEALGEYDRLIKTD